MEQEFFFLEMEDIKKKRNITLYVQYLLMWCIHEAENGTQRFDQKVNREKLTNKIER